MISKNRPIGSLLTCSGIGSLGLFFSLATFAADAPKTAINAELSPAAKRYIQSRSPIIVMPNFKASEDAIVPFNFANPSENRFDSKATEQKRHRLATYSEGAVLEWDMIEVGGAVGLYFMPFRPVSSWKPTSKIPASIAYHSADAETIFLIDKKPKIGPVQNLDSFDIKPTLSIATTAFHGTPLFAATSEIGKEMLPPNFFRSNMDPNPATDLFLKSASKEYMKELATSDRDLLQFHGHPVIVSEEATHALAPATKKGILPALERIDISKAVIYLPPDFDNAEIRSLFKGARFVSYSLAPQEFSRTLRDHGSQILGGHSVLDDGNYRTTSYYGEKLKFVSDLRTEFKQDSGSSGTGANGYWGWGIVSCSEQDALGEIQKMIPENHKRGRTYSVRLEEVLQKSFPGFLNKEEIKAGGYRYIRNPFMTAD